GRRLARSASAEEGAKGVTQDRRPRLVARVEFARLAMERAGLCPGQPLSARSLRAVMGPVLVGPLARSTEPDASRRLTPPRGAACRRRPSPQTGAWSTFQ